MHERALDIIVQRVEALADNMNHCQLTVQEAREFYVLRAVWICNGSISAAASRINTTRALVRRYVASVSTPETKLPKSVRRRR